MRNFLLLIFICLSLQVLAQKDYRRLSLELVQQALDNRIINERVFLILQEEINKIPDDKLNLFFQEKAKVFFVEIAYGHKPANLQYSTLIENIDTDDIENSITEIEN